MKLHELTLIEAEITWSDLNKLEKTLDDLFAKVNIDIAWHGHFKDRINDIRAPSGTQGNGKNPDFNAIQKSITIKELELIFRDVFKKYGAKIAAHKAGYEGLIFDINSKINIPFILQWDKEAGEISLIAKTIMRVQNFNTRTKKFKVNT